MIRSRLNRLGYWAATPFRAFLDWQSAIPDEGRITVIGLLLISVGFLPFWNPQPAAIVPGMVLAGTGLGFRVAHPIVAAVTVAAVALIAVAWVVVR